jgi:hypothetical protein
MSNRYLIAVLEEGERLLQATFSNKTPWADNIRPNIDNHVGEFNSRTFYPTLVGKDRLLA